MVGEGVGRVSGHEQTPDFRIERQQPLGQFTAVHLGHHHIGHEQLDLPGVLPGEFEGLSRRVRRQNPVAQTFEHGLAHLQQGRFILNQQDGLRTATGTLCLFLRRGRRRRAGGARQIEREGGPRKGGASDVDHAVVLSDDAVDRGQAQADPLAEFLGGEEGVEDPCEGLPVHAAAVVAEGEHHVLARLEAGVFLAAGLVQCHRLGRNGDAAPGFDGVPGVDRQAGQDLFDLGRIDPDLSQVRPRLPIQRYILPDDSPQQVERPLHGPVQVEHPGGDRLFAGKGQQLAGEVGRMLGGLADALQVGMQRVCRGELRARQLRMAEDHPQHIVEVMGHPTRQPANGFQFVGLGQLVLEDLLLLCGTVALDGRRQALHHGLQQVDIVLGPCAPTAALVEADETVVAPGHEERDHEDRKDVLRPQDLLGAFIRDVFHVLETDNIALLQRICPPGHLGRVQALQFFLLGGDTGSDPLEGVVHGVCGVAVFEDIDPADTERFAQGGHTLLLNHVQAALPGRQTGDTGEQPLVLQSPLKGPLGLLALGDVGGDLEAHLAAVRPADHPVGDGVVPLRERVVILPAVHGVSRPRDDLVGTEAAGLLQTLELPVADPAERRIGENLLQHTVDKEDLIGLHIGHVDGLVDAVQDREQLIVLPTQGLGHAFRRTLPGGAPCLKHPPEGAVGTRQGGEKDDLGLPLRALPGGTHNGPGDFGAPDHLLERTPGTGPAEAPYAIATDCLPRRRGQGGGLLIGSVGPDQPMVHPQEGDHQGDLFKQLSEGTPDRFIKHRYLLCCDGIVSMDPV